MRAALTSIEMKKFESEQKSMEETVTDQDALDFIKKYNIEKIITHKEFVNKFCQYLKEIKIE